MCWVPFIFISGLHNQGVINASSWYTSFAMTVLPLNSVINPLIYDKSIGGFITRHFLQFTEFVRLNISSVSVAIIGLIRTKNRQPENIPMDKTPPDMNKD